LKINLAHFHVDPHVQIVDGHAILTDVLTPKKLLELGPDSDEWKKGRPVVLRIHGGGLAGPPSARGQ